MNLWWRTLTVRCSTPGDVDGLAHSLVKLINTGEGRIEMGKASVERVKPYDWKHIADAYLALYADILE